MVINPPANIVFIGITSVWPPSVFFGVFVDWSECIRATQLLKYFIQPCPFLRKASRILLIWFPVFNVNLFVNNINVTTKKKRCFVLVAFKQFFFKKIQETIFSLLSYIARWSWWKISRGNIKVFELTLNIAAFLIKLLYTQIMRKIFRLFFCKNSNTTIALLNRLTMETVIILWPILVSLYVFYLSSDLLKTNDVCILIIEPVKQSFFVCCSYAVYI